ncbi:Uncharacterised protein [Legionella taurinensis]|nr:Uncharacterised protein [Legionella taurinensis]
MFFETSLFTRIPKSDWENDYCTFLNTKTGPVGHYIEYKTMTWSTKFVHSS